jgi:hypothetical protein
MRICTMLLAAVAAASLSTAAVAQDAKRAKAQPTVAQTDLANSNANSWRLLKDSLPLIVPMPVRVYMLHQKSQEEKKATERRR